MTLHEDELAIDDELVRRLVDRAGYTGVPLHRLAASGSSNALFRLGDDLLVRLPRQPGGTTTIEKEARWAPAVAAGLPVEVPEVVRLGVATADYPERWSIVRWIDGSTPAVDDPPPRRPALADGLAAVVRTLRDLPVPEAALADPELRWYRADPLAVMDQTVREALLACRAIEDLELDLGVAGQLWRDAMALPGARRSHDPRWLYADLVAENLLERDGRMAAVLDLGGLAVGDPAVDLVGAWELFGPADRERFRISAGVTEEDWLLGRAWTLALALNTLPYYWRTMPARCHARLVAARAVLAE